MALFRDSGKESDEKPQEARSTTPAPVATPRNPVSASAEKDSVIGTGLHFEGSISGKGSLRVAGRFTGDVDVQGTLTVETGAHLNGSVKAETVIIAGEMEGNIEAVKHVELREAAVLHGDLSAASLTVAAGSRMRGQVSFGWDDPAKAKRPEAGSSSPTSTATSTKNEASQPSTTSDKL